MATTALSVTVEESSPVTRTLKIELPADRVSAAHGSVVSEFRRHARVPGFRPGKAPIKVVENNYKDDIERTLLERLIRDSIQEAMTKVDGPVLNVRDVQPEAVQKTEPFRYSAIVEIPPKIELKNYKKLKLLRPARTAAAKDVDEVLDNLRVRNADYAAAAAGEGAETGDRLTLTYGAYDDGVLVPDGQVNDHQAELGAGALHPKFEEKLLGATAGQNLEFKIAFGDQDAPSDALKNKTIEFKVDVVAMQKRRLPELDDAFAALVLPESTLESLRQRIENDLNASYTREGRDAVESQAIQQLLADHDFSVPEGTVSRRRESLAQETAARLMRQGYPKKAVQDLLPMILGDSGPRAERDVKVSFLLDAIAKQEKIEVSDADVEAELTTMAAAEGQAPAPIIARAKAEGFFENIRGDLQNRKALTFIVEQANIKDVSPDDYKAHLEKSTKNQAK